MSPDARTLLLNRYPHAVVCSALTGEGLDTLQTRMSEEAARQALTLTLLVPYERGDIVALAHDQTHIVSEEFTEAGTCLVVRASRQIAGRPAWWLVLFFIPIVSIVAAIILFIDIAKAFGKGAGFGIGLALLGFIFYPMLGFGDAQYQGAPQHA